MEKRLKLIANIDVGIDQITFDKVFFDQVALKLNEHDDCEVFVVWNEGVGMERGMFFPTQRAADSYFVAITEHPSVRTKMFPAGCCDEIIKQKPAQEKTDWQKMLVGLPLSDTIIGMSRVKESTSCLTENP